MPMPLVLLHEPQPKTEQLSSGIARGSFCQENNSKISVQLKNLATYFRFSMNIRFRLDSRCVVKAQSVHGRNHVTKPKSKQRVVSLILTGFHNQSRSTNYDKAK